jgi:hypothetical protein
MGLQMVKARVTCRLYGALCARHPEGWGVGLQGDQEEQVSETEIVVKGRCG